MDLADELSAAASPGSAGRIAARTVVASTSSRAPLSATPIFSCTLLSGLPCFYCPLRVYYHSSPCLRSRKVKDCSIPHLNQDYCVYFSHSLCSAFFLVFCHWNISRRHNLETLVIHERRLYSPHSQAQGNAPILRLRRRRGRANRPTNRFTSLTTRHQARSIAV